MPSVRIPTPLRSLTGGESKVDIEAATVGELIHQLNARYPGMSERLLDEAGELRRFVNVYVDGDDIRFKDGFETTLANVDEISIVPSVAGGSIHTKSYPSGSGRRLSKPSSVPCQ